MSVFSFLSHFFLDLFNPIQKAWDKLPANIQSGLLNGSGILHIINQYSEQDPKLTIATIQANYPDENLTAIYNGLALVAKSYNLNVPDNLEELIYAIQSHLKNIDQSIWPSVISNAAQILAMVLTGTGTPFEIVSTLIQFVFTSFIKNNEIKLAVNPA